MIVFKMENEVLIKEMLKVNLPESNLQVLELILSDFKWDSELALKWMLINHLEQVKTKEEMEYFPMGDWVLSFSSIELFNDKPGYMCTGYSLIVSYKIIKEQAIIKTGYGVLIEHTTNRLFFDRYKESILNSLDPIIIEMVQAIF
jgi:hypothetical protein